MSFTFDGKVLEGVRQSPVNSPYMDEPGTGVVRDIRPLPSDYILPAPDLIDAYADQYRTAILEAPGTTITEYMVWAQNTAQLATVDDPSWWTNTGTGSLPLGNATFSYIPPHEVDPVTYYDGTTRIIVVDDGNKSISNIICLVIAQGDIEYDDDGWVDEEDPTQGRLGDNPYPVIPYDSHDALDQNPVSGVVSLTVGQLALFTGHYLSRSRGDRVIEVRYTVASPRFWWTRNDRYETRFGWNGRTQRWEPWKGSGVKNLGYLLYSQSSFLLTPKVKNLPIGALLPGGDPSGGSTEYDKYSMFRLGTDPGTSSIPTGPGGDFGGIMIRANEEIDTFDFSSTSPPLIAVMGQTSGKLLFNPAYVKLYAGRSVWYSYRGFYKEATGFVGKMMDAKAPGNLFIAPLPGPTDFVFLRYGCRTYLDTIKFDDDATMNTWALTHPPAEGQVYVSLSTGRLILSAADLAKADPSSPSFSKYYLGEDVIYDGVALNSIPQPTKAPVRLVGADGHPAVMGDDPLFILESATLPTEFSDPLNDTYRGLGVSGVLQAPDKTGSVPVAGSPVPTPVRPGGDTFDPLGTPPVMDPNVGMIRALEDGVSDCIIFGRARAIATTYPLMTVNDIPRRIRGGRAYVILKQEEDTTTQPPPPPGTLYPGARVVIGRYDRQILADDYVYFLQASLTPAIASAGHAKIYSRNRELFRFERTEKFYFAVDGTAYTWDASTLPLQNYYYPQDVVDSINAIAPGTASEKNGRIVLTGTSSVEIGFGVPKDLSGASILGFLPGWRAVEGRPCWMPDSGASVGLFRSPVNKNRVKGTPDFSNTDRLTDGLLTESIQPNPFFFFDNPPLQDIAGMDENIFFQLISIVMNGDFIQILYKNLDHYQDIIYRFGQKKFDWIASNTYVQAIERATDSLVLGNAGVVPESMQDIPIPGLGGGLWVNTGNGLELQAQDDDYILPFDGVPGNAVLIHRYGRRVLAGAQGIFTAGSDIFTDTSVDFTGVLPGYRLKVTSGKGQGSYRVEDVPSSTTLSVTPSFLWTMDDPITWELYEGVHPDNPAFDPMVVADMVYQNFNHLPEEPFKIRVLSTLGPVPVDAAAQEAQRLKANVQGALASNRVIGVRYGANPPDASNVASLTWLTKTELGTIQNGVLAVSNTASVRFATRKLAIQVGTQPFTIGDALHPLQFVTAFDPDPGLGTAIQCLTVNTDPDFPIGALKFGSQVLSTYANSKVLSVDVFLDPADLLILEAEISPWNGDLNLSAIDMTNWSGVKAYFVEQMDASKDMSIQPQSGNAAFFRPLPKSTLVEMEYYGADLEGRQIGNQITEFLPVFVRDEIAVRESPRIFTFNSAGRTINKNIEPIIYIRAAQQNYNETNCVIDYLPDGRGRLTFVTYDVTAGVDVKVTYAVAESLGGEQAYESSTKPVYRPPFFIKAGQYRFGLRGDRVAEFEAGQLFRFGPENFYVKGAKYYADDDITAVYIYPSTINEVGSRAPARDVLAFQTLMPITPVVDPNGETIGPDGETHPVPTDAYAGLMETIDISPLSPTGHPFEPINRGQTDIAFLGNLPFAIPGHIIEFGGIPYTITGVKPSDDGTRTIVTLASGIRQGFIVDDNPTVRITRRPVYPPSVRDFLGVGNFVPEEGYELVLYGLTDKSGNPLPGKTLVDTVDYTFDVANGIIKLLEPIQDPLDAPQSLLMSFVRRRGLAPFIQNGAIVRPTYMASYVNTISPSEENGLMGGILLGTYTFRNPDTFYFRVVPMPQFLVEISKEAIDEITSQSPASGAPKPGGGTKNWENGRVGLKSERKHLVDKDRVARTFMEFYNTSTGAFEQIEETISGAIIGDRDGKFKFFIGHGREWPTPGYEDDISGTLTLRNIWTDVFSAAIPDPAPGGQPMYVYTQPFDPLLDPEDFSLIDAEMDGDPPDTDVLRQLIDGQRDLVQNEVDDFILSGFRIAHKWKPTYPFYRSVLRSRYRYMYQNHRFSRIFPRWTRTFLRTTPGVDAIQSPTNPNLFSTGWYSHGRYDIKDEWKSTNRATIGQIANPVLGEITEVRSAFLSKRQARARIWRFLPNGLPAGAFGLDATTGMPTVAVPKPCLIATPGTLRDFPINPATGYPDSSKLLSQGGTVGDLVSGDPEMAVPPFKDMVLNTDTDMIPLEWGFPDGNAAAALCGSSSGPSGSLNGIYVDELLYGCVMTFKDSSGNAITDPDNILVGTAAGAGTPAAIVLQQGDTVRVVSDSGSSEVSNPPSTDDMEKLADSETIYREGFDYTLTADGEILDRTMKSKYDPAYWNWKEISGQNPPPPMTCLEGPVEFYYEDQNPLEVPGLQGDAQDDSGDYHVPFLRIRNTELDRFNDGGAIADALEEDDKFVTYGDGLYPDEYLSNDGCVTTIPPDGTQSNIQPDDQPAALLTSTDDTPKANTVYVPGTSDLSEFDLLFMQVEPTSKFGLVGGGAVNGPMGIHSIGRVQTENTTWHLGQNGEFPDYTGIGSMLEPPRFITPTKKGSPIRYRLENAMVSVQQTQVGVLMFADIINQVIVFDFEDLGAMDVAGMAALWGNAGAMANNIITLKFISHADPNINHGFGPLGDIPLGGIVTMTFTLQGLNLSVQNYWDGAPIATNITNAQFGISNVVIETAYPNLTGVLRPGNEYILLEGVNFVPLVNIWDPTVVPPPPPPYPQDISTWFLPYTMYMGTANEYRQLDYGMDFTFDIDTYNTAANPGQSTTAWIDTDRLTFHEGLALSFAKERGYVHPLPGPGGISLETRLSICEVTVGHDGATPTYTSTIDTFCNGINAGQPVPFTFLPRGGVVGTFAGGEGSLTVMGFEGYDGATGNIPILGNLATFSAAGSNDYCKYLDPTAVPPTDPISYSSICHGTGKMESLYDMAMPAATRQLYDNRISEITITSPTGPVFTDDRDGLGQIESGDIVVVKASASGEATTKAGTYLVRHVIRKHDPVTTPGDHFWYAQNVVSPTLTTYPTSVVGNETGWCPVHLPTFVSYDSTANTLTISDPAWIREIDNASTVAGFPVGWRYGFPSSGYIYIVRNVSGLTTVDPGTGPTSTEYISACQTYKESVLRLAYSSFTVDGTTGECTFTLAPIGGLNSTYAGGNPAAAVTAPEYPFIQTAAELDALLDKSYPVSGMNAWPVNVSGETFGLPPNNCVGFDDAGATARNGFMNLTVNSTLKDTSPVVFPKTSMIDQAGYVGAPDLFYPAIYNPALSNVFYDDPLTPIYHYVVCTIINTLGDANWKNIDLPTTSIGRIGAMPNYYGNCLLPTTQLALADTVGGNPGHKSRSGIYFEPSFPRQALNLIADHPRVVNANDSLADPSVVPEDEREIGARSSDSYGPLGGPPFVPPATPSEVSFEVRRIRRFHDVQYVNLRLAPLRYVYEIRRGRITDYEWDAVTTGQRGIVTAGTSTTGFTMTWDAEHWAPGRAKTPDVWNDGKEYIGTNLGPLRMAPTLAEPSGPLNPDVNVHPGDMFRLLNNDTGALQEEVMIEKIIGPGQIQLAAPGLVTVTNLADLVGMRFEIYLRRPPVPQEQSVEQLLDLITYREIMRTDATWGDDGNEKGGYVSELAPGQLWDDVANIMGDDLNVDGSTTDREFGSKGVKRGDIVIVDPLGRIPRNLTGLPYIQERGMRPMGDMGVKDRTGYVSGSASPLSVFTAGYPDARDDNRGYYRVKKVEPTKLTVTGITTFTGDIPDKNVVFDASDDLRAYAVYPTVSASQLNPDPDPTKRVERQMDLRPTKSRAADGRFNYPFNYYSIRPFSYRIIRPNALFSPETIDLVISSRERVLSLIELIGRGFEGKSGDYWTFQKFVHIEDLGSTWNPEDGLGLLSNAYILSVLGRTDVSPFMNNSACLSILDRRFWVYDTRLDSLAPSVAGDRRPYGMRAADPSRVPPDVPYTAYNDNGLGSKVNPVLPDRIEDALEQRDRFRPIRYVWLAYRTHTILGVLPAIARFDAEYVRRRRQQLNLLLKREALEKARS